ncbi:endo alpha-1,4 polygalactosaminidase [Photobacterium sanguinicancri]|uniref:endo alpha-1,4 polygalactosaminidase n=1 Tax=Photobacterium sanguinicancri TaxID=875932 RepID=UPI0026E155EF|nr:endo alpha-1,4 polygalactosaminidase [Photobacterium sanguinicancri]MDO6498206.1 endo alpha-1,4 polygalactosaminidase [Photobacterium sanguinicancri]
MRLLSAVLVSSLLLAGCNSGSEQAENNDKSSGSSPVTPPTGQPTPPVTPPVVDVPELDPNVEPITNGSWYRPAPLTTWQWQLSGTVNTSYNVDIYNIDLFDSSTDLIQGLQQSGKKVICYFSAGSYEDWRPDAKEFKESDLGNNLDGWPGERWLDIRSKNVISIMTKRLELAKEKGCDGVELDNMDGYTNSTGINLTNTDQLAYNRAVANTAHQLSLSIGLKNDLDQILELVDYYDFAINESCTEYNECHLLNPFIQNGKAVLNAEYLNKYVNDEAARNEMCTQSKQMQFSTLVLPLALDDSFRISCL